MGSTLLFMAPTSGELVSLLILVGIPLYFLPSYLAYNRKKRSKLSILLVNLFFGWTTVGWFIALIWAVSSDKQPQNIIVNNQVGAVDMNNNDTKKCSFCAEIIKSEAIKCKHCGEKVAV